MNSFHLTTHERVRDTLLISLLIGGFMSLTVGLVLGEWVIVVLVTLPVTIAASLGYFTTITREEQIARGQAQALPPPQHPPTTYRHFYSLHPYVVSSPL